MEAPSIVYVNKAGIENRMWDMFFPAFKACASAGITELPEELDCFSARILDKNGKRYFIVDFA